MSEDIPNQIQQLQLQQPNHEDSREAKVSEFLSGFLQTHSSVDTPIRRLLGLHSRYLGINEKFQQDLQDLENRYLNQYRNLYEERCAIVNASRNEEGQHERTRGNGATVPQGIPEFWLAAIKNNRTISRAIHSSDEAALRHLKDVRMEYLRSLGFKLYFEFNENEFFRNKTLTKTFTYEHDEDDFYGELMDGETAGIEIDWKPGMNQIEKVQQLSEGEPEVESFFKFFDIPIKENESNDPDDDFGDDGAGDGEWDPDDDDSVLWDSYMHFELGEEFKDTVIPHALYWYTGEAALDESDDDDEEGPAEFDEASDE